MKWGTGDDQSALKEYRSRLGRWFRMKKIKVEDQYDYIFFHAGSKGEQLSQTANLSNDDLKDPSKVWAHMEKSVGLADNFRVHRLTLLSYVQEDKEYIDDFYTRCRTLALKCKFSNIDERLIDQLINATRVHDSRKELLKKDDKLTVEQALDICRTHEASEAHLQAFNSKKVGVDAVKKGAKMPIKNCGYCGGDHEYGSCPAFHHECGFCHKKGHYESKCLSKAQQEKPQATQNSQKSQKSSNKPTTGDQKKGKRGRKAKKVHGVEESDVLCFDAIKSNRKDGGDIMAIVNVRLPDNPDQPATMKCKIDTGAQGNVLPLRTFKKMCPSLVDGDGVPVVGGLVRRQPFTRLDAYNGTEIVQHGVVRLTIQCSQTHSDWITAEFYVAETPGPIIVGKTTSEQLRVITVNIQELTLKVTQDMSTSPIPDKKTLTSLYPGQFKGLGKFPGEYHIDIDPEAKPVVHAPRRYPIHLRSEIEEALDEMKRLDVIEPIPETESTQWLNSLAFSRKQNGKLRVCLDPKDLNAVMRRTYHRSPTLDEVTHRLAGATVFSKLDAKHGYWSVQLDAESSALTSFSGPSGRFRFKRLPFGLRVSQDVFQEKMDLILAGCPGVINLADDIVVFGKNAEEHDSNLHRLMRRAESHSLVLNDSKCHVRCSEINFFGMVYTKTGVKPDPQKTKEIADLPSPTDAKMLMQFLGMVQYLSPFIPHLSDHTAVLRGLLKKEADFKWTATHEQAFKKLKSLICNAVTLNYFDPSLETKIQVDASKKGLGSCLLQITPDGRERVIAFASKALTEVEERYANIEREMLAVVHGAERFHTFVYGSTFVVESDHKPLEAIHLKNISGAPPRLQRMLLRIQAYDLRIAYRPGKELLLADAMSRLNPAKARTIELEHTIHMIEWTDQKSNELRQNTDADPELRVLKQIITEGWPDDAKGLPKCVKSYWSMRDLLSIDNGVILKGERVLVPASMRSDILDKLHIAHQGVVKTNLLAQTCVYWPGITKEIERKVGQCEQCMEYSRSLQKESMRLREIPTGPWRHLATDLFEVDGQHFLLIADYYSKMPFVKHIRDETSSCVIAKLKTLFSEHGIPDKLYSDGGPCYISAKFQEFATTWNFKHITSSPRYPQSNGFAERMVQTCKLILRKAKKSGTDPELAMLQARCTPVSHGLGSPADLLYGRKLRAGLPLHTLGDEDVRETLRNRSEKQAEYYNQGAKDLPELHIGQQVAIQDADTLKWRRATVEDKHDNRSYTVTTETGSTLRRNRRHLRDLPTASTTPSSGVAASSSPSSGSTPTTVELQTTSSDPGPGPSQPEPRRSARTSQRPERLIETL